jgi:bifunctional non-homologous end joining protein LigD
MARPASTVSPSKPETIGSAADFVSPMLCEPVHELPHGPEWIFEIKLDGFRVIASRPRRDGVTLWSRNHNSLNRKFFYIADALGFLPPDTLLDGELVALDAQGRTQFSLLQSFRSAADRVRYVAFDVLRLKGRDLMHLPLIERKRLLRTSVEGRAPQIVVSGFEEGNSAAMLRQVREHKLEGVVAKRMDSVYQPGERSGAWVKHRVNQGQEFVAGGYIPGPHGIEALLVGFYRGEDLLYVTSLRAGFTAANREEVFVRIKKLATRVCPFANLPQEGSRSRWGGEGMTSEKMKKCVWLRPELVVQVEFLEWTGDTHLRHAKFVGIRVDKKAKDVGKES